MQRRASPVCCVAAPPGLGCQPPPPACASAARRERPPRAREQACRLSFSSHQLLPMGSYPRITHLSPTKSTLP